MQLFAMQFLIVIVIFIVETLFLEIYVDNKVKIIFKLNFGCFFKNRQ